MAIKRIWVTCTPEGKDLVQAAITLAGLGGEITPESWVPYPSPETPKVYWIGWQGEEAMLSTLETLILSILGARVRRGPVRPSAPQMSAAEAIAQFPLPNSGPPASTVVSLKAALRLHYRDFLLGPFDDIGLPGAIDTPPAEVSAVATEESTPKARRGRPKKAAGT